jgi:flavin reductase
MIHFQEHGLDNVLTNKAETVSTEAYLAGMRAIVQPVGLVTAACGGERDGVTAVTVCSATMEPPTLLISIKQDSAVAQIITRCEAFGVSFLADTQARMARRFSDAGNTGEKLFSEGKWLTAATGAPLLDGAVSAFDCRLVDVFACGGHSLFLGRVVSMISNEGEGLLYGDGYFRRLASKD